MGATLGLVANIYNEVNALPGWLETHLPFFDDVRVYHAGPQGNISSDGTMELLEKWNVPYLVGSIDDGFGATRTRAIRSSPCDWVMVLDADERFYANHRVLVCKGEATPQYEVDQILSTYDFSDLRTRTPNWNNVAKLGANLRVITCEEYDQGALLRRILDAGECDAVATVRRHWHGLGFKRPTQNWYVNPDWQLRVVRNSEEVYYDPGTKMHERLVGARSVYHGDPRVGPFFDHFHFHFKEMEVHQRAHDIAVYDAIHAGRCPPTREEFDADRV